MTKKKLMDGQILLLGTDMSVKIDNSNQYSKKDETCPKCGIFLNTGMVLHNIPENCKKHITYPFMKIGESMHFECYLQHVIDCYIKERGS